MRPKYSEMAAQLGLGYCSHCGPSYDHVMGEVDQAARTIHYTNGRFTWPRTKRFLLLAVRILDDPATDEPSFWLHVYRRSRSARNLAQQLGLRVPRRYWDMDRAMVRAGVAGLSNEVPYRKEAYDWARR